MPYLASHRGDYLASHRGDPGLFGFIGKALKGGLGLVSKLGIPVVSGVAGIARGVLGGRQTQGMPQGLPAGPRGMTMPISRMAPTPAGRPAGGYVSPYQLRQGGSCPAGFHLDKATGAKCVRNRRMDVANPRALRRAIRRQSSFVSLARKALKGSGYTITSRGGARRRAVNIRESGPGSVTVR